MYGAVRAGHRALTVAASVSLLAVLPLTALVSRDGPAREAFAPARNVLEIAWLFAEFAAGEALRQAERRAEEAERTREESARRRADEERLHIARELHDSLTHQISVIKLQSEVAVHTARRRGERVPESCWRSGRPDGRRPGKYARRWKPCATTTPARRTASSTYRNCSRGPLDGPGRDSDDRGATTRGAAAVARTAYSIVQEALTNTAATPAPPPRTSGSNTGPTPSPSRWTTTEKPPPDDAPVSGLGLLAMRERVTALGGRLHARPLTGHGFTVRAELPVERTS